MKDSVIAFVFARGGSKGVPRKNIKPLAGKPLIAWAIECALASRWVRGVVVSTDDEEIAEVARRWGAETPFLRPAELAADDSPEWLAWRHAIQAVRDLPGFAPLDVFAAVPCTAPLRAVQDLDACIEAFLASEADLAFTVRPARCNPYFAMVRRDEQGYVSPLMPRDPRLCRRQDAPPAYDIVPLAYVTRPDYVMRAENMFAGRILGVPVPEERSLDIDTELDFQFAEFMMARRRAGQAERLSAKVKDPR